MEHIRVATFNIKHASGDDGRVDHGELVRACSALDADVIGLQEVDCRRLRSWFRNQAKVVAARLRYTAVSGPVLRRGVGWYGNALLARGRVHDVHLASLPKPSERQARGAIIAGVALPAADIAVAVTHLQHQPPGRRDLPREAPLQLGALLEILGTRPPPRIVVGDLNLGSSHASPILAAAGYEITPRSPTFPVGEPRLVLDYVAVQGLRVVDVDVVPAKVSDHRAVVTTLAVG